MTSFMASHGRPTSRKGPGGLRHLLSLVLPSHAAAQLAAGGDDRSFGQPDSMAAVVEAFDVSQQQRGFESMHSPSPWLADLVREAPSWPAGCTHLRAGGDVALPVVGPAWLRRRFCWDCRPSAGADTVVGRTCDRCYRVCDPGEQAASGTAVADSVLVYFLLCLNCAANETSTGEAS